MSKLKDDTELITHKELTIKSINDFLDTLISSSDYKVKSKSDKLCYWLEDYIKFLSFEEQFNPTSLKRYKRGEIIKVHLGYNIGSEEGGLHYAIVLDKEDSVYSPVLTIVPLTSVKPNFDLARLRKGEVFLGNEIFTNLISKVSLHEKLLRDDIDDVQKCIESIDAASQDANTQIEALRSRINSTEISMKLILKMKKEVLKMKVGSIALINQITTISKIRIYDPKTNHDVLSGIKLSNERLDSIDIHIANRYIKKLT